MSANTIPRYPEAPQVWQVQVSTANANRDGTTGTYGTLLTGGTNGTLVEMIRYQASVTTTAGAIRLFIDDGANVRMIHEMIVTAVTVGAAVAGDSDEWVPTKPLVIPSGWIIKVSTENAEAINVFAFGGEY